MTTMSRQTIHSLTLIFVLSIAALTYDGGQEHVVAQPAPTPANDNDAAARQIKELQKQMAELQRQVKELKSPRIIAAGTVTIRLGPQQDNKTNIRVKLPAGVASQLGGNYIVELANRYPTGGSFFVPYWRPATDGFDILLADPSLVGVGMFPDRNSPYYVDWIVVQKGSE
jgi:hypothetical protein